MQADVRELVLGYMRAKGVAFGWQQGTVVVPDTSKIRAAASGRPELRLTFDRDLAQAIEGVDYVTFGHPVFEQIREELRQVTAYCERYWGSDQVDENNPPHVRWGARTPTISAATRTWDELLVVRFQLDVVSDFRHQETFAVVVDLETGKVAPEKARLCQHSPRSLPLAFAPAPPRIPLDDAVEAAKAFADERRTAIVGALRIENAQRVAADLAKAAQGDQDAVATEHLRRELLAKARIQASLRALAIERWFVERELVYSVRVPGWSTPLQAADAVHDPAKDRTTIRGWNLTASAAAPLLIHLCDHEHPTLDMPASCGSCGRHFCPTHLGRCDLTGEATCLSDLAPCDGGGHPGQVRRSLLVEVADGGGLVCPTHRAACAACARLFRASALAAGPHSNGDLCGSCRIECGDCGVLLRREGVDRCSQTEVALCAAHATCCAACAKTIRQSLAMEIEERAYCPEHVFSCSEGHRSLAEERVTCVETTAELCRRHALSCVECGSVLSSKAARRSGSSGEPLCSSCARECAQCRRPFRPAEVVACARSKAEVCADCRLTCDVSDCGQVVALDQTVEIDGRRVCAAHTFECAMTHPAWLDRQVRCQTSGRALCPDHVVRCGACEAEVAVDQVVASAETGRQLCPACRGTCSTCSVNLERASLTSCALSGALLCGSHRTECAGCQRIVARSAVLPSGLTQALLCPGCRGVCAQCGVVVEATALAKDHETEELVCSSCATPCATCSRHLRLDRSVLVDDVRHCPAHVSTCSEGHPMLAALEVECAVTAMPYCPRHVAPCSACGAPVAASLMRTTTDTGASVCPTCGGACADCSGFFVRSSLLGCGVTGEAACPACRTSCEHDGCGRTIRRSVGVEIDARLVCPEHVVDCIGHRTTRDRAVDCGRTGRPRCAAHVARCAACDRTVGSDVATASTASGMPLCHGCAVTCGACKHSFAPSEVELESDTKARLCGTCDRVCAVEGCGRHVRAVRATRLEDQRDYCPDHVFQCEKGHAAVTSARLTCAMTKRPVCGEHVVACSGCSAPILTGAEFRSKATSLPLCSACGAACAGCSSAFERGLLIPCGRSGQLYCADDRLECAHHDCGLTVGRAQALEVEGRLVCREHVVLCDSGHPTTHDAAVRCTVTSAWVCQAHAVRCADCSAVATPRGSVTCAATGDALCQRCAVKCSDCKRTFRKDKIVRCERSGETVCEGDARRCEAPGCGRRIWRGLARDVGGRTVCPQHLFQCFAGHPALIEERRTCVVSGRAGCPVHLLECSSCASTFAPEHGQRTPQGNFCPRCVGRCFECQRPLPPAELITCMRSGKQVCAAHAVVCSHAGCGKRIRSALSLTVSGRVQCKEHQARCSLDAGHVALEEDLHECPGDPYHEQPCEQRICPRPEHACVKCKRPVCPTHLRKALGEPRPRYCAECLASLPRCQTCTMPLARAAAMCPPCATLVSKPLDPASGPPGEVLDQCRLGFPRYGAWRHASFGDAEVWEREVRFGTVRVARLGKNPGIYEKRLGPIAAVRRWLSGG